MKMVLPVSPIRILSKANEAHHPSGSIGIGGRWMEVSKAQTRMVISDDGSTRVGWGEGLWSGRMTCFLFCHILADFFWWWVFN
jgi:hypothetical protein